MRVVKRIRGARGRARSSGFITLHHRINILQYSGGRRCKALFCSKPLGCKNLLSPNPDVELTVPRRAEKHPNYVLEITRAAPILVVSYRGGWAAGIVASGLLKHCGIGYTGLRGFVTLPCKISKDRLSPWNP